LIDIKHQDGHAQLSVEKLDGADLSGIIVETVLESGIKLTPSHFRRLRTSDSPESGLT
jgi:hypothetical protein